MIYYSDKSHVNTHHTCLGDVHHDLPFWTRMSLNGLVQGSNLETLSDDVRDLWGIKVASSHVVELNGV